MASESEYQYDYFVSDTYNDTHTKNSDRGHWSPASQRLFTVSTRKAMRLQRPLYQRGGLRYRFTRNTLRLLYPPKEYCGLQREQTLRMTDAPRISQVNVRIEPTHVEHKLLNDSPTVARKERREGSESLCSQM